MKKLYILPILFLMFCSSCKNALDIAPQNSITYGNIRNEKDIESLMNAVDNTIRYHLGYPNNWAQQYLYYFNEGSEIFVQAGKLKTRANPPSSNWSSYYQIIHQANIPLRYLDQTDMSEERKDYYRGRVYFYKAFAYLWLIRVFGDVILIKDDVILDPVSKTPWPIVADYAIDLAEKAVALLPEYNKVKDAQGNSPFSKFVVSKGAANCLLADLAAWKAGTKYLAQAKDAGYNDLALWKKAADACTEVINSGQYSLAANPEELCETVFSGDSRESIYEIDLKRYWDEITIAQNGTPPFLLGPSQPQIQPNPNFSNFARGEWRRMLVDSVKRLFSTNDLRRKSFFYKLDSLSNVPALKGSAISNKFRKVWHFTSGPQMGQAGIVVNPIFWRLAGIYLLRAECRARLGETDGAIADLNIVRARSKASLYQSTEGNLRYVIYEEKVKKELLFEQHSFWFDVVRNEYVRIEPTLKPFDLHEISNQDLTEGVLFEAIGGDFSNNPLLRQNTYWFKRFGR